MAVPPNRRLGSGWGRYEGGQTDEPWSHSQTRGDDDYDYTYCPLTKSDDIRILTVRNGTGDNPIECWLTTRSLTASRNKDVADGSRESDVPSYEALSYHWGEGEATLPIKIFFEKLFPPGIFKVRQNLHSALKQLRLPDRPRRLWIDAVCINQKDIHEKNSQVSLMARVYAEAQGVCVWLGDASDDSALALNFIGRVVNLVDFDRLVTDRRTPQEWSALASLMKRPWFSRRWVVQEIAFATQATLYCGSAFADWSDFAVAVSLFEAVEEESRAISKSIQDSSLFNRIPDFLGEIQFLGATRLVDATSNLFRKSKDGQVLERLLTLEALVSNLSAFEASRPHDIIYAVLALAKGIRSSPKQTDAPNTGPRPSITAVSPEGDKTVISLTASKNAQPSKTLLATEGKEQSSYAAMKEAQVSTVTSDSNTENERTTLAATEDAPVATAMVTSDGQNESATFIARKPSVTSTTDELNDGEQDKAKRAIGVFKRTIEDKIFTVDYEKSFFEVCKDFLALTIRGERSLDIICRPWAPELKTDKCEGQSDGNPEVQPTWLITTETTAFGLRPDGNYSRKNADTLVGPPGSGKRNYNACAQTKVTANWRFGTGPEERSMFVEGFVIDYVRERRPYAADGIVLNEWLAAGGWSDQSQLPPDPFWRTLVADRGPKGLNPPTFYPRACKSALNQSVKGGHISTNSLIHYGTSTVVAKFARRVQEAIWMRRLIITDRDFLGLAPEKTKKRDLICIFYGCSVPVVLRKQEGSGPNEEYFEFIGECYVHGLMDGEAFAIQRSSKNGSAKKRTFELR